MTLIRVLRVVDARSRCLPERIERTEGDSLGRVSPFHSPLRNSITKGRRKMDKGESRAKASVCLFVCF